MVASGIPPHVTLASRMNTIEDKIDSIIDILNKHHDSTRHTQSKDERNAPATLSMMTDALAEMHARLVRDIVQQPISVGQLDSQNATTHEPQRLPLLQPLTKKLESFPAVRVYDMWNLWFAGSPDKGLSPFRHLKGSDFVQRRDQSSFSKAKFVVQCVVDNAGTTVTEVSKQCSTTRNELFERGYSNLCSKFPPSQRHIDLKCHTVYDLLKI